MADVHTPEQRHRNMTAIKSSETTIEVKLRKELFRRGFRYRKNDRRLPGKPDIVLPKYRTVIFVNGCFWHQHSGCRYATIPSTRQDFWIRKFNANKERDKRINEELTASGWNVITVWECQLKTDVFKDTVDNLCKMIQSESKAEYISNKD